MSRCSFGDGTTRPTAASSCGRPSASCRDVVSCVFIAASAERVTRLVERSDSSGISVYSIGPLPKSTAEGLTFSCREQHARQLPSASAFPSWRWCMKNGRHFMRVGHHCQLATRISCVSMIQMEIEATINIGMCLDEA